MGATRRASFALACVLLLSAPRDSRAAFTCAAPGNNNVVCAALGDLYAATGGASWSAKTGWAAAAAATATSYCSFAGVSCSGSTAVSLSLLGNGLNGTLPSSLGFITTLTSLNLAQNALSGSIPSTLGQLSVLTYLNMSGNALSGVVPASLAALYTPCEGFNLISGKDNVVIGCDNEVAGDGNVVRGSFDTVVGDGNELKLGAFHDTVFGDANTLSYGASYDTVGGSANSLTYGSSHVSVIGGGNSLVRGTSGSVVVGSTNTLQEGAANVHVVGVGNTLSSGVSGSQVTGDRNTVQLGASGVVVSGYKNLLKSGVGGSSVAGNFNQVQDGSNNVVIHGDSNVLNAGVASAVVNGDQNTVQAGASGAQVSGNFNTVRYGANNAVVAGDSNMVQAGVRSAHVNGTGNVVQWGAGASVVNGDHNTLSSGAKGSITGNSNSVDSVGGAPVVVVGNSNHIRAGAGGSHVTGSQNSISDGAHNANITGDENTVGTGSQDVLIVGTNNRVQSAGSRAQLIGSNNLITAGSNDAHVQGSGNTIDNGSRNAHVVGDLNTVNHGSGSATVRGASNSVADTQQLNLTGSSNQLSSVSASSGGVNIRGSGNTLSSVSAPTINLQRSGATLSGASGSPVVRRRLLSQPMVVADLSGNNLQWTCDTAGVAGPPNSATTCAALWQLFRSTSGSAWTASWAALDRWPTRNLCTSLLPGLVCSRNGSVTGLLLNSSGLSGTLPAALGDISSLTALDLSGNPALTGAVPASRLPLVTTLKLGSSGVCLPAASPLTQSDSPAAAVCPPSPPPPPSPPRPPMPPPPPSPAPVFGPLAGFAGAVSCRGVDHHFESATADELQASVPVYHDIVAGSTWSLTAAIAAPNATYSPYTGLALIGAAASIASTVDLFSVPQQAWLFRGSNGALLQASPPSASLGSLGTALGFSWSVWFRVDAGSAANPDGNAIAQLIVAAGPTHSVVLSLVAAFNTSGVLAVVAHFTGGGASTTDADYAVSSSTDEFGPSGQQPNDGNALAAIGDWQHAVITFNGAGLQTGLYWNGRKQLESANANAQPLDLGLFFGGSAPYGPVRGGSLGFDSGTAGANAPAPLVGAVGDWQIYGYELDVASVLALYTLNPDLCTPLPAALSPPPAPTAPPGGFSPPPPAPPPRAPRPPVERLVSGKVALCLTGAPSSALNSTQLEDGMQSYLGVFSYQVLFYGATDGCDASLVASRRLLYATATASFLVQDLTASMVSAKLSPLYGGPGSGAARSLLLNELVSAGAAITGLVPIGVSFVAAAEPPPSFRPPLPPGATPASQLAAANAGKHSNNGVLEQLRSPGAIIGYTLAALVVLFVPVYFTLQCMQAGHERRTCVSAALVFHVAEDEVHRAAADLAAAITGEGGAAADLGEASRFKAPLLAAALEAQLSAAVAKGGYAPKKTLLRPLLRAPLLAALGAAAKPEAAFPGDDAATLALRHKPTSMRLRLKRSLRTELHWQGRELRQLWRRVRRLFSRSKDAGKVFRHAPEPAAQHGTSAILVEITWKFASRDGASAWRHVMRTEAHLGAMEAALQAALCEPREPALELVPVAAGCVVALLDDEPHARLDKKKGDDIITDGPHGERTTGLSPAVAVRLQEVLRLSLRSLNTSRAISAARRSSLAFVAAGTPRAGGRASTGSEGGHTLRSLYATPRPSVVEEEPRDDADAPAKRVELLAAVSTQVDEAPEAAPASNADDEEMAEAAPEVDAAV